jgi:hypothetical protein
MEININKPSDDRYYSTTNLYLASYLFAKGAELVNVNRDNPKRAEFIFSQNLAVVEWIDQFDFEPKDSPEVAIDPRTFITAIKSLKDILYREGVRKNGR